MSQAFAEFSLAITKVSVDKSDGGVMRWRAVASDTAPDLYNEAMSLELFDDFIHRINEKSQVPPPFDKALNEDWRGGMPYLSIAHYKSGTGGKNVPGMPEKIYRDGTRLKAVGTLHDTDMGRAVFRSLCDDLYSEKAKQEGKIRISIGFLDLVHKHDGEGKNPDFVFERKSLDDKCPMCQKGAGKKVYLKGQLVHLALTRVPVNPRTDMEVDKAMTIETKKEDAASIIGVELSDTLEEKSLVTNDVLVVKAEEKIESGDAVAVESDGKVVSSGRYLTEQELRNGQIDPDTVAQKARGTDSESNPKKDKKDWEDDMEQKSELVEKKKVAADKGSEELTYEEEDEAKREERRNRPAGERSLLQKSFDALEAKVVELKSRNVPAETALREVQELYNALGENVKKSFEPDLATTGEKSEVSELVTAVKSLAESLSTFQQSVSTELATLKAQVATEKPKAQGVPEPRSLSAKSLTSAKPNDGRPLSIKEIAYRSTFQ